MIKLHATIQLVFKSRKSNHHLGMRKKKVDIVKQQCVCIYFKNLTLCDAGYVGYTIGHLHSCAEGHRKKQVVFTETHDQEGL